MRNRPWWVLSRIDMDCHLCPILLPPPTHVGLITCCDSFAPPAAAKFHFVCIHFSILIACCAAGCVCVLVAGGPITLAS